MTCPIAAWPIALPSRPDCAIADLAISVPSSIGGVFFKLPPKLPIAERVAERMNTSVMKLGLTEISGCGQILPYSPKKCRT